LTANGLIACYHERGSDELANRAIKDFGHEQLPFKRFAPNAAWYYTMLVGHFLLESFKEDVGAPVVAIGSYASTVNSTFGVTLKPSPRRSLTSRHIAERFQ
jgi:hypothetical protein